MKKLTIAALTLAALLSGCSSSPNQELLDKIAALEEQKREIQEDREELAQDRLEEELDEVPDWVLEPPQPDATGFYGVGVAKSKLLSHGLKAARLQASFDLAKMYKQELSGSERAFERGDAEGNVSSQTTFLIDNLVRSVPVVGYQIIEQKVVPMRGVNNVYVLLKLPYEEFNKVLLQEKAKTMDQTVQAAFDDLERRLDKRRAQAQEDEQRQFDREQEALQRRADIINDSTETNKVKTSAKAPESPLNIPINALNKGTI